jgi:hypothetical protein
VHTTAQCPLAFPETHIVAPSDPVVNFFCQRATLPPHQEAVCCYWASLRLVYTFRTHSNRFFPHRSQFSSLQRMFDYCPALTCVFATNLCATRTIRLTFSIHEFSHIHFASIRRPCFSCSFLPLSSSTDFLFCSPFPNCC